MEFDKKKVALYIQKDLPSLDYIDISTELTRFLYKKPLDTLVHSISDKLSSPLETLKRRGIPVDRLLKSKEQQQQRKTIIPSHLHTSTFVLAMNIALPVQQTSIQEQQQVKDVEEKQQQRVEEQMTHFHEANPSHVEGYEQNGESLRGFFQSLRE